MTPEEKTKQEEYNSLPIVNSFCMNLQKLQHIIEEGKRGTEDWATLVRKMRAEYNQMWWKHQKQMEKWRHYLQDYGFYDKEADLVIDVSDIDTSKEVEVEGNFNFTKPIISEETGNKTYQYNQWSIPRDELPEEWRKEIYEKSMRNAMSTEKGIQGAIENGGVFNQSSQPQMWSLADEERDWS